MVSCAVVVVGNEEVCICICMCVCNLGSLCVSVGQYGAVSTLDLSQDGTRLLCGYAKGLVRE